MEVELVEDSSPPVRVKSGSEGSAPKSDCYVLFIVMFAFVGGGIIGGLIANSIAVSPSSNRAEICFKPTDAPTDAPVIPPDNEGLPIPGSPDTVSNIMHQQGGNKITHCVNFENSGYECDSSTSKNQVYGANTYSSITQSQLSSNIPQTGIIPEGSFFTGMWEISLRNSKINAQTLADLLVGNENMQHPPYINQHTSLEPYLNADSIPDGHVSILTKVAELSTYTDQMFLSMGFSKDIWVNIFNQEAPQNFNIHREFINPFVTNESDLPFTNGWSPPIKDYFTNSDNNLHFRAKRRNAKRNGDIFISVKHSSKARIEQFSAYMHTLLEPFYKTEDGGSITGRISTSSFNINSFNFFDSAGDPMVTKNPCREVGPICRAWTEPIASSNAKRVKHGDVYVDLGKLATTFIGDEEPQTHLRGGSFAMVQWWFHDLPKFKNLSIVEQNDVFGRVRSDQPKGGQFWKAGTGNPLKPGKAGGQSLNKNLPFAHIVRAHVRTIPPCSHGKRFLEKAPNQNDLWNGTEQLIEASQIPMQIYRQAIGFNWDFDQDLDPFKLNTSTDNNGLLFVGFARDTHVFDVLLERMIGASSTLVDLPDGEAYDPVIGIVRGHKYYGADTLTKHSHQASGQYYYFPNMQQLIGISEKPFSTIENMLADNLTKAHGKPKNGSVPLTFIQSPPISDPRKRCYQQDQIYEPFFRSIVEYGHQFTMKWMSNDHLGQGDLNGVRIIIGGCGISGMTAALELKRWGAEVLILEGTHRCGGRAHTYYSQGVHAELGPMRFPGYKKFTERYKDEQARVYHYNTDWYMSNFDIELQSFANSNANAFLQMGHGKVRFRESSQMDDLVNSVHPDFLNTTEIISWNSLNPNDQITNIGSLMNQVMSYPIERELAMGLDSVSKAHNIDVNDMSQVMFNDAAIKDVQKVWGEWAKKWSSWSINEWLSKGNFTEINVEARRLEDGYGSILPITSAQMQAFVNTDARRMLGQSISVFMWMIDDAAKWWADPMYTPAQGVSSFVDAFLYESKRGKQASSIYRGLDVQENVRYGLTVAGVEYRDKADGGKKPITVTTRHEHEILKFDADYVILTFPTTIINDISNLQNKPMGFNPPLSTTKQAAFGQLHEMASTKVQLFFWSQFWKDNCTSRDDGSSWSCVSLPLDQRIDGGSSITPGGVVVYPTAVDYDLYCPSPSQQGAKLLPYEPERGIIVLYLWGQYALNVGSMDHTQAISYALSVVEGLHPGARTYFESGKVNAFFSNQDASGAFGLLEPGQYDEYWTNLMFVPEGEIKPNEIPLDEVKQMLIGYGCNTTDLDNDARRLRKRLADVTPRRLFFGGDGISTASGWIQGATQSALRTTFQLYYQEQFNADTFSTDACNYITQLNPNPNGYWGEGF